MRITSWNVNGYRAVWKKEFLSWLDGHSPDVLCLQETKSHPDQLTEEQLKPLGYNTYWSSAEKRGYSGVSTFSKSEPLEVKYGIGIDEIDSEGRILTTKFENVTVVNAYFPNSQREHTRLDYKLAFCVEIQAYLKDLVKRGENVVLCGDYNVAHKEIDLKNPKTNKKNAGFLPEERDWMSDFLSDGFDDCFRLFCDESGHYTWWSYRPGVREKNVGWRIDYFCTNSEFSKSIKSCVIHPEVMGSDHCPLTLTL